MAFKVRTVEVERRLFACEIAALLEKETGAVNYQEITPVLPGGKPGPSTFIVSAFCTKGQMKRAVRHALESCVEFDDELAALGVLD